MCIIYGNVIYNFKNFQDKFPTCMPNRNRNAQRSTIYFSFYFFIEEPKNLYKTFDVKHRTKTKVDDMHDIC